MNNHSSVHSIYKPEVKKKKGKRMTYGAARMLDSMPVNRARLERERSQKMEDKRGTKNLDE